ESTTLTQDLVSNDTCITIGNDSVVLDCAGYSIKYGWNKNSSNGVFAIGRNNITVRNCNLVAINSTTSYEAAINFTHVNNSVIENNNITTNGTNDNYGILLALDSNNNIIRYNNITTNGTESELSYNHGIYLYDEILKPNANNTIIDNIITSAGKKSTSCIHLIYTSNNTILRNNLSVVGMLNNNVGIYVLSQGNNISWNNIQAEGGSENYGIDAYESRYNKIFYNTIKTTGNTTLESYEGPYVVSSDYGIKFDINKNNHSIIYGNTIITNSSGGSNNHGIYLFKMTENTLIAHNNITIDGGASNSAGIFLFEDAHYNTIENNRITTLGTANYKHGIYITEYSSENNFTYNVINTSGTANNYGIRMHVAGYNLFNFTNITTSGTNSYAIHLFNGAEINAFNTILDNPAEWIYSNGDYTILNLTNTTFKMQDGSINFPGNIENDSLVDITKQEINISQNKAFVKTAEIQILNTSAIIILNGLSFTNPKPMVDYEDDGSYADCPASQCSELSYSGGTFVFNTTHFTGYAADETGPSEITGCPVTINYTTTLTQNLESNTSCIEIGNSSVILDCSGYWIRYNGNGADNAYGIFSENTTNITIQNCNIVDINLTGTNAIAIQLGNVSNSTIALNNLTANGTHINKGISLVVGVNNTMRQNNIIMIAPGNENFGITLEFASANIISGNNINATGNKSSIGVWMNASNYTTIVSNTMRGIANGSINSYTYGVAGRDCSGDNITNNTIWTNDSYDSLAIAEYLGNANLVSNNRLSAQCPNICYGVLMADGGIVLNNTINLTGNMTNAVLYGISAYNFNVIANNTILMRGSINYGIMTGFGVSDDQSNITNNIINMTAAEKNNYAISGKSNVTASGNTIDINASGSYNYAIELNMGGTVENNRIVQRGIVSNSGIEVLYNQRGDCKIQNNSILSLATGSDNYIIYTGEDCNITNNTIRATGTNNNYGMSTRGDVQIFGNWMELNYTEDYNAGISAGGYINVSNNTILMTGTSDNYVIVSSGSEIITGNKLHLLAGTSGNYGIWPGSDAVIRQNSVLVNATADNNMGLEISSYDGVVADNNNITVYGSDSNRGINLGDQIYVNVTGNNITIGSTGTDNVAVRVGSTTREAVITGNVVNTFGDSETHGVRLVSELNGAPILIENNTVRTNTSGTGAHGIALLDTGAGITAVTVSRNLIIADGANSHGIFVSNASDLFVDNNITSYKGYAIMLDPCNYDFFGNNTLTNPADWVFASPCTETYLENTTFQMPDGSIRIVPAVLLENGTNATKLRLRINSIYAFLNSTNLSEFNTSAVITFEGAVFADPRPMVDYEDDGSYIVCPPAQCSKLSYSETKYVFNTTRFTAYTLEETPGVQYNFTNISITKTDSPDPVNVSQYLNYTINVTISGNGTAYNVTVNETYPPEVIYQSSQPTPVSGTNNTWVLGNLTATNITINITVLVLNITNNTLINNTANATCTNETNALLSAFVTENTTVLAPILPVFNFTNISITKEDSPDPVDVGTLLNYTINVTITGNGTAYNVTVNDTYPSQVWYVSSQPDPVAGTNNTWVLGNLTNGTLVQINITVNVSIDVPNSTIITNLANATYQNETSALLTDFAIAQTTINNPLVLNRSNISITKSDNPDPARMDSMLNYTITVTSNGDGPAYNVTLNDTYPPEVIYQ
ncbi:MAG: right-handed parallel beta-helix repeat-containing protein, partial [Candidatus Woesearchaeota archaeon]